MKNFFFSVTLTSDFQINLNKEWKCAVKGKFLRRKLCLLTPRLRLLSHVYSRHRSSSIEIQIFRYLIRILLSSIIRTKKYCFLFPFTPFRTSEIIPRFFFRYAMRELMSKNISLILQQEKKIFLSTLQNVFLLLRYHAANWKWY